MFCSSCGSPLGGGKFCSNCGAQANLSPVQLAVPEAFVPESQPTQHWESAPNLATQSAPRTGGFHALSRFSLLAFGGAYLIWTFAVLLLAGSLNWTFSDRLEYLSESPRLWLTLSGGFVAAVSILLGILSIPTWARLVFAGAGQTLMWGVLIPLVELERGTIWEYEVLSPITLFFNNLEWLADGSAIENLGIFYVLLWPLSLLVMQTVPVLLTISMLGATIKAKHLA